MKENLVLFKRKDFVSSKDPDISIESRTQMESEQAKQRSTFLAIFPQILQDPTIPEISKVFAKRKAYRLSGMTRDESMVLAPRSADEMKAWMDVDLINS